MTDLKQAAQQALEALEWISDCYVGDDDDCGECASCHERSYKPHATDCKKNNAISALRAALSSEPEALAQEQAEIERLRADIATYVGIANKQAAEIERLRAAVGDFLSVWDRPGGINYVDVEPYINTMRAAIDAAKE